MRILVIVMIFVLVGHGLDAQTPWEQVSAGGFGDSGNTLPWSMAVFDDHLYVGCFNWTTGAQICLTVTSCLEVPEAHESQPENSPRARAVLTFAVANDRLHRRCDMPAERQLAAHCSADDTAVFEPRPCVCYLLAGASERVCSEVLPAYSHSASQVDGANQVQLAR